METEFKKGLGRFITPVLLVFALASGGYGWYSRQTVNRLQSDLERAVAEAEAGHRMAEMNAMEARRQAQLAMQSQKVVEERFLILQQLLEDCQSGKKR